MAEMTLQNDVGQWSPTEAILPPKGVYLPCQGGKNYFLDLEGMLWALWGRCGIPLYYYLLWTWSYYLMRLSDTVAERWRAGELSSAVATDETPPRSISDIISRSSRLHRGSAESGDWGGQGGGVVGRVGGGGRGGGSRVGLGGWQNKILKRGRLGEKGWEPLMWLLGL